MDINEIYKKRKKEIKERLKDFDKVGDSSQKRLFKEMAFCLCTPQSKAKLCWRSVENMRQDLFTADQKMLMNHMKGVRFHVNKSRYILEARDNFFRNKIPENNKEAREFLVDNFKGLGMKEASHFLRNVGKGKDIAILDRHILKNLAKYGVISEVPETLTKKKYLDIEKKMREFSKKVKIPMEELDLLFWAEETGEVFK